MNKNHLRCPQCGRCDDNIDADDEMVYHCYNCGYPDVNWYKKETKTQRTDMPVMTPSEKEKKRICKPRNGECVDPARYDIYGCFGCPFGD